MASLPRQLPLLTCLPLTAPILFEIQCSDSIREGRKIGVFYIIPGRFYNSCLKEHSVLVTLLFCLVTLHYHYPRLANPPSENRG